MSMHLPGKANTDLSAKATIGLALLGLMALTMWTIVPNSIGDKDDGEVNDWAKHGEGSKSSPEDTLDRRTGQGFVQIEDAKVAWQKRTDRPIVVDGQAAELLWEKRADKYIQFLRRRSFKESAYRTSDASELIGLIGNDPNSQPHYRRTPRMFARTRRFRKLFFEVNRARASGELDAVLDALHATVRRFLSDREKVEAAILELVETEPELFVFARDITEKQRQPVRDLFVGYGLTGYDARDGAIPTNLKGIQYGLLANSMLLGLTEDSRAIEPLLDIARYDGKPFGEKLPKPWDRGEGYDYTVAAPHAVVADALDRILVACSRRDSIESRARAIAEDYVQWRSQRRFPARKVFQMFPYDGPSTSYGLSVTGVVEEVETVPFELPFGAGQAVTFHGPPVLTEEKITKILEWAERLYKAERGTK